MIIIVLLIAAIVLLCIGALVSNQLNRAEAIAEAEQQYLDVQAAYEASLIRKQAEQLKEKNIE